MSIFVTSDHHFGHENIIKHCNRPFADADEMDQFMVDAWNSVVGPDDTVYHLGDLAHKRTPQERVTEIVGELNGSIELLVGNHELDSTAWFDSKAPFTHRMIINTALFASVNPGYRELFEDDQLVVMSHYAMETWHDMGKKSWSLHGHSHGKLKKKTRRLDVGVDTHDFRPWSWKEIKQNFGKLDAF